MEIAKIVRRVIIILVIAGILWFCYKKYTTPVYYPEYSADEISRIIVTDNESGDQLNIVNPSDIEKIIDQLSAAELKVETQGVVTPADSYKLTLYNSDSLEIVDFNPVIIVDNDSIQKEPVCYRIERDTTLYDDIETLFEQTENMEQ